MVFQAGGQGSIHGAQHVALQAMQVPHASTTNFPGGPKFLANFKLPKFDGATRSWKS
jgi:hypothetical protein